MLACNRIVGWRGNASGLQAVAHGIEFLRRVERVISLVLRDQLIGVLLVKLLAVALAVRAVGAAHPWAFIRYKSAPFEAFLDVLFRSRHVTGLVGVLDTQKELATMLTREQVVVQCRAHTAHVQGAGGARGETDSYGHLLNCSGGPVIVG